MKKQHWYSRSRSVPASPRRGLPADAMANPGCMSMVHYLIFAPGAGCVGRPPSSHDAAAAAVVSSSHHAIISPPTATPCTKGGGLEAPRNSLELEADELRDIQIGVQIEPAFDALAGSRRRSTNSRVTAPSSEAETPRTPSLVARLMGIDGLPDSPSPSPGLKPSTGVKEKKKRVIPESMNKHEQPSSNTNRQPLRSLSCNVGAGEARSRSLPDTPRASTSSAVPRAAAWEEDVVLVDRPRLSLQVLKESVLDRAAQYMSMPNSPTKKKKKKEKDESRRRDSKEYAREIVRQAKETVTNRNKTGSKLKPKSAGSDKENAAPYVAVEDKMVVAVQLQAQAGAPVPASAPRAHADQQQLPHAPRLPSPPSLRAKPSRPPPPPPPPDHPAPTRSAPAPAPLSPQAVKCKRPPDGCERFATRTIRKPGASAAAAATIHQAAPQASSSAAAPLTPASSSIGQHRTVQSTSTSSSRRGLPLPQEEDDPEYSYLRCVLERGGFMRTPPPNRPFKGHSVSAPVDPLVFHLLELDLPMDDEDSDNYHRLGPLRHRWNRKLLFHLAQEILADILLASTPLLILQQQEHGPALLGKVWRKVKAFPAADCRVVGDIDALVAGDLAAASVRGLARHPAVAEEAADVADDVAERLLDALLAESLPSSPWSPSRAPRCQLLSSPS